MPTAGIKAYIVHLPCPVGASKLVPLAPHSFAKRADRLEPRARVTMRVRRAENLFGFGHGRAFVKVATVEILDGEPHRFAVREVYVTPKMLHRPPSLPLRYYAFNTSAL